MIVATANLNFGRSPAAQFEDADDLLAVADVVAVQECVGDLKAWFPDALVVQMPDRREGLVVKDPSTVVESGVQPASVSLFGQRIRRRTFPWARISTGVGETTVVSVHMPPRRMWRSPLDDAYARSLRGLLRGSDPWIAVGDWNGTADRDPAGMGAHMDGTWYGPRIDLACVSPAMVPHVLGWRQIAYPDRGDNHPAVLLELRSPVIDPADKKIRASLFDAGVALGAVGHHDLAARVWAVRRDHRARTQPQEGAR